MIPLTIGTTLMGAHATQKQGELAMSTARRNAEVLKNQNRQDADTTLEGMTRQRIENSRSIAAIRNRMAGSGVRTDTGSSSDYLEEATSRLEVGILDKAREQELRSRARDNQAEAEIYRGKVAKSNAKSAAIAQLIQGGAKVAGQAYGINQQSKPGEFANNAFGGGMFGQKWF